MRRSLNKKRDEFLNVYKNFSNSNVEITLKKGELVNTLYNKVSEDFRKEM